MKVKELIEKLNKCDKEKEVVIRFAVVDDDEIGYVLFPKIVDEYYDQIALYSDYPHNKEGCDFMGQVDLATAYRNECPNMTGDEMLKNLGYINETDEFSIKSNKIFEYMLPLEDSNFGRDKHITFWKDKTATVGVHKYDEEDGLKTAYIIGDITPQEIKAIYQKCKELGWIE